MFTDKQITVYRNIKAPADLCQKITKPNKRSNKIFYLAGTLAACFLLLITGFFINSKSNIVINVNGQQLTDSIVFSDNSLSNSRSVSPTTSIPIEINVSDETKVIVSEGFISVDGSNPSNELVITSSKTIWWEVDVSETIDSEMLISDKKGVEKINLKYENTKITITKENVK